jgi:hypothetical protein
MVLMSRRERDYKKRARLMMRALMRIVEILCLISI